MRDSLSRLRRFLRELRRRNVYRVAVTYTVVAFGVWQGASLLFPALDFPGWTVDFVIVLTILGLPMALVGAWALEVTPEGVRRTDTAGVPGSAPAKSGPPEKRPAAVGSGPAEKPETENSIAVLPFADMSPKGDQAYFADGLAEELLNALSQLRDLRVAARTSSFAYRSANANVQEIGRELGVGAVLEGSVRKAGDRLRVTAQLVDARDGYHLWSETFDRELEERSGRLEGNPGGH